jgi:C1A family cysteine protease
MKTIDNFMKKGGAVALLIIAMTLIIIAKIYDNTENETLVLYKDNPELQKINKTLKNQVSESESKILVLEAKIETLEKTKKQQSWNLSNSTQNLESEVVEVVKIVQDSTLIFLLDRVKIEQKNLVKTYENIIELKDSVIFEQKNLVQSYVFATDKMSNEIEILHAKNNELIINESRNKGKIKKRNKIIVIGGSVVAAGIVGVILLSR